MTRCGHGIDRDRRACELQGPRPVMNLKTVGAASAVLVIQAVSLGQEVLDRACRRRERRTCRFVDGAELRTLVASPRTLIVYGAITALGAHDGGIVRQVE